MDKANNSLLMKAQNRSHVLRLIRQNPLSRAEIARLTGLTRAAVSIIVDKLLEENLIYEGEAIKSLSGRHPTLLHINNSAFYVYAVDITRDGCFLSLCDFSGTIIKKDFLNFQETADKTVEAIFKNFSQYNKKFLGIGISSPGPVDSASGKILDPPNLNQFTDFNIVEAFKKYTDLPVFLEKDTNALALNEKNITNKDNFLYLLADHGLGGAFIKDGILFKGAKGLGCEIGHITLNINGARCSCGNVGCASLYTSAQVIAKKAQKSNYDDLCDCAFSGDRLSLDALKYQGEALGHSLVTFVNLFEPQRIILGGVLKKAVYFLKPEIEGILKTHRLSKRINDVIIEASALSDRASSPAQTVLEHYFNGGIL